MGFADSSSSTLHVGKSTTLDSAPADYQEVNAVSHSLAPQAGTLSDSFLGTSGLAQDSRRTTQSGSGDIGSHWLPADFDIFVEVAARGAFGTAVNETLTVSFGTPGATGIQTIDDDGATGGLTAIPAGTMVEIGGAVADPLNAGLRMVVASTTDQISVYNPTGVVSAADAGVDIDNNGTCALGTTASWLWAERIMYSGATIVHSEWYKNQLLSTFGVNFPAASPSEVTFGLIGDKPVLDTADVDGSDTAAQQRAGTVTTATGVEFMVDSQEQLSEVMLYSPTEGKVVLTAQAANWGFTMNRPIDQVPAIGTSSVVATTIARPELSITLDALLTDAGGGTGNIIRIHDVNPDDLQCWGIFGTTVATSYGVWFDTVRINAAPDPVSGPGVVTINGTASATNMRITRR